MTKTKMGNQTQQGAVVTPVVILINRPSGVLTVVDEATMNQVTAVIANAYEANPDARSVKGYKRDGSATFERTIVAIARRLVQSGAVRNVNPDALSHDVGALLQSEYHGRRIADDLNTPSGQRLLLAIGKALMARAIERAANA